MSLLEKMMAAGSIKVGTLADSSLFNEKDVVPTSVPSINVAFSGKIDGGMVSGLTVIAGPSKHFKSSMGLIMVKAYLDQFDDAVCLFYDSEYGITPEYIKGFGIDGNRVIHIPLEHIEQLKFDIMKRLEQIERKDHVIIFIDSIGNLASKKEMDDALDEKSVSDMTRAKQLKSLFRMMTPHLVTKNIPCIAVNHIYMEQGLFPKAIVSGGCLLAGTKLQMADGTSQVIEHIKVGDKVSTLIGAKEVSHTWNPETLEHGTPECYEIEFEDGYIVTCSENHPFLTDAGWVNANKLTGDENIVALAQ